MADPITGVRLIACSLDLLAAEDHSAAFLCRHLGVAAPPNWPPDYSGPETRAWLREALVARPEDGNWWGYYVIASIEGLETLAGTAGFKGPPDPDGVVEIGYSVVAAYRRRGIALRATTMLIERALADARVTAIVAETLPGSTASQALLARLGFAYIGKGEDPDEGETWQFRRERSR